MTLKAFIFLLFVTIVAVTGGALIAEMLLPPGFERGIVIAVLSGLVVFPAARWAEYRGWIQGTWSPGGEARRQRDAQAALRAEEAAKAADPAAPADLPADPAAPAVPATVAQQREGSTSAGPGPDRNIVGPDRKSAEPQPSSAGQAPSALAAGDFKHPGDPR